MTKKYIINGVEIEEFKIDPNMDTYLQGLPSKFNQLLDALDEKKEEPKSTLKEEISTTIQQNITLIPLDQIGDNTANKIISLFKESLLKEMKTYSNIGLVTYEDIEEIIKNL